MRVAGLAPIDIPLIENVDVSEFVAGHMAYRAAMPRILRECGWLVESDEFTEIEDPDPDNHEKRQRELINEIEEARRELEKKPEKKRFGLFGRNKKLAAKKEWEMYDEQAKTAKTEGSLEEKAGGVLFDIDAIRAEAAELAAQGIHVKQLESTLPPMKLSLEEPGPSNPRDTLKESRSSDYIANTVSRTVAGSSSSPALPASAGINPSGPSSSTRKYDYDDYDEFQSHDGDISMTFDTSYQSSPMPSYLKSPGQPSASASPSASQETWKPSSSPRPPLHSSYTSPAAPINLEHNAWADDDEFGKEQDIKMTFA